MNPHPKKGQIVRPGAMPNNLLAAYLRKLGKFKVKPQKGARYNGYQVIHYYTCMDEPHATFCVQEEDDL